ncbi:hypothetical protein CAOG_002725 [Capsaspora owczarzaki ATCC 30864]|uniref:FERM domain-containing protein n=2 Tax=Capsaspora owczarzaki (strain ATCC 30864) TaxID=595528 RepID=A0A0D2VN28_CAPO3|nr:hypothetical protein CAOG_002725 [Capsaspora owczarzaki ATCC 30864]
MQAVFGDFNPAVHVAGFLDENKEKNRANLLPRVLPDIIMKKSPEVTSAEWHRKIFELHQRLAGWSVAKAEAGYVTVAQQLPQYGVSFHEILDTSNVNRMIGISLKGIHFYESSTEQPADVSFSWSELDSTYVQGSKFAIQLKDTVMPLITVRMKSKSDATELLDMCIGYHMRFNRVMEQQRIAIAQRSGNAPTPTKSGTSPNPATAAPAPAAAPAASSSAAPAADTAPIAYDETVINQEEKAEAQLQKTVLSKNDGKGTVRIKVGANLFAVSESQDDAEDLPAGLSQARKALDEEPPAGTKDPFMNTLKRVRNAAKDAENTFLMFAKMIEQNPDSVSDIDIDKLLGGAR